MRGRPAGDRLRAGVLEDGLVGAPVKLGASLTSVTVMVNVCVADWSTPPFGVAAVVVEPQRDRRRADGVRPPACRSACRRRDRRAPPQNSAALVLFGDDEGQRLAGLVGRARADRRRPAGDGLRAASSSTVWSAPFVKLGASLTAVTVIVNVCVGDASTPPLAVPPSSVIRSVIVAVPFAFAAGV